MPRVINAVSNRSVSHPGRFFYSQAQTMRKLTPREEKFAQGVADGLSQAEAYRQAYQSAAGWKDKTVWSRASELMADSKVSGRVEELRAELAKQALWSRMDSVATLKPIATGAEKDSDRIAAVKVLNEMHGYNAPTKLEHTGKDGGPIRTQTAGDLTDEELAAELAKYGITS